jgi:hypothetical protein
VAGSTGLALCKPLQCLATLMRRSHAKRTRAYMSKKSATICPYYLGPSRAYADFDY